MGQQLESGRDAYGAVILSGMGNGSDLYPANGNAPLAQKALSLPRHLTRPAGSIDFAHPTEQELARVFTFYQVEWVYEPTTFHLDSDQEGRPIEQVCPDFYLPDHDVYVELTTMRQSLVTRKNRKIRRLKEAFPTVQVRLLYRKDYDRLMGSLFGVNGNATAPVPGKPIISDRQLQQRVNGLAAEIGRSRGGAKTTTPGWGRHAVMPGDQMTVNWGSPSQSRHSLRLIGLGAGSQRFLTALGAELRANGVRSEADVIALSKPGTGLEEQVRVSSKPGLSVDGRDVVLVADVVSTGLSASFAANWLRGQGARSVRICSLFDRTEARILDVPIEWTGFVAPEQMLVGFGISYQDQFDDLPAVSPLRNPARSRSKAPAESESPTT